MRKIILTLVAILSMTTMMAQTNNGEPKGNKKMSHEEMTNQMTSKLNLNDSQKAKVADLNKKYQDCLMQEPPQRPEGEKMSKAKDSKDNKKPAAMKQGQKKPGNSQNQAKRQEYEKELKQILTDDQYQSYQKMQPQHKGNGPKGKQNKTTKTKE